MFFPIQGGRGGFTPRRKSPLSKITYNWYLSEVAGFLLRSPDMGVAACGSVYNLRGFSARYIFIKCKKNISSASGLSFGLIMRSEKPD